MDLQYSPIGQIAASPADFTNTELREYFSGWFTSNTPDTANRVIPESEFPSIVEQVKAGIRILDSISTTQTVWGKQ